MDLLLVPVPVFNKEMAIQAYYFRYQWGNDLMVEGRAAGHLDGAMNSPLLEILRLVGIEPFAMDKPIFVPISAMMLLGDLQRQCPPPFSNIIFLMREDIVPETQYITKIQSLKAAGFRFAMQKVVDLSFYSPVLEQCAYLFLNQQSPAAAAIESRSLPSNLWHLKLVATHIDSLNDFNRLSDKSFSLFEGRFYRIPITKGKAGVSPLKANTVRLLNTVQDESFEFNDVSEIIQRDPALSVSLMKMVNSPYIGLSQKVKTINHAIAILGQQEVRKWATAAVSYSLGADRPDEITRLSLIRAKFAENLAVFFDMSAHMQSLFLTGLFSVLDMILELPMDEALKLVHVSDDILHALVDRSGPFYPILALIYSYESADWKYVSRQLIVNNVDVESINSAYIDATLWYKDLINDSVETDGALV